MKIVQFKNNQGVYQWLECGTGRNPIKVKTVNSAIKRVSKIYNIEQDVVRNWFEIGNYRLLEVEDY